MKNDSLIQAVALCTLFALGILLMELIVRKRRLKPDISRRVSHVISGLFALLIYQFFSPTIFLICNCALLLFITFSYSRNLLSSIHNVKRKTYGELFLPLGILLTFLISEQNSAIFIPAVLVMALADAGAGIVADIRQKKRASRIGSVVFFIITALILSSLTKEDGLTIISIALIATATEKVSTLGSDNFTTPLVVAILLLL